MGTEREGAADLDCLRPSKLPSADNIVLGDGRGSNQSAGLNAITLCAKREKNCYAVTLERRAKFARKKFYWRAYHPNARDAAGSNEQCGFVFSEGFADILGQDEVDALGTPRKSDYHGVRFETLPLAKAKVVFVEQTNDYAYFNFSGARR